MAQPVQLKSWRGIGVIRGFMALQAAVFLAAVSIHFGLTLQGYQHRAAGTAESVIAAVLLVGLVLTWAPPPWARRASVVAQSFGILGVIVGLITIVAGVGPRTTLDLAMHGTMLVVLIAGLIVTLQSRVDGIAR